MDPRSTTSGRDREQTLLTKIAEVAKLADAPALGAGGATRGSSNLPLGTNTKNAFSNPLEGKNIFAVFINENRKFFPACRQAGLAAF